MHERPVPHMLPQFVLLSPLSRDVGSKVWPIVLAPRRRSVRARARGRGSAARGRGRGGDRSDALEGEDCAPHPVEDIEFCSDGDGDGPSALEDAFAGDSMDEDCALTDGSKSDSADSAWALFGFDSQDEAPDGVDADAPIEDDDLPVCPDDVSDGIGDPDDHADEMPPDDGFVVPDPMPEIVPGLDDVIDVPQPLALEGIPVAHCADDEGPILPPRPDHDVTFYLPGGGKIAFYKKSFLFEATCPNREAHGVCRLTRTGREARGGRIFSNPFQGRCLGLLVSWLSNHNQDSKADHLVFSPDREQRIAARIRLQAMGPVALDLLACERARDPGIEEPQEPEFIM